MELATQALDLGAQVSELGRPHLRFVRPHLSFREGTLSQMRVARPETKVSLPSQDVPIFGHRDLCHSPSGADISDTDLSLSLSLSDKGLSQMHLSRSEMTQARDPKQHLKGFLAELAWLRTCG